MEQRLIDANALIELLAGMQAVCNSHAELVGISKVWQQVKHMPTIDAVLVIRCEDCKFVGTDATCCLVCKREGMGLKPFHVYHDDYCSYAERKEE